MPFILIPCVVVRLVPKHVGSTNVGRVSTLIFFFFRLSWVDNMFDPFKLGDFVTPNWCLRVKLNLLCIRHDADSLDLISIKALQKNYTVNSSHLQYGLR